jgi:mono/diheme cytochrome c family protein
MLAACAPPETRHTFDSLPVGDPASGEKLFAQNNGDAPACTTCHTIDGGGGTGPSLQGLGERAGTRVEGQSAEEYAFESIIRPARSMVQGYSNLMYAEYDKQLEAADIADLIAYILTL